MRSLILCLLCVFIAHAADPYAGLQFTDGQARTAADFKGQTVITAYFCSH